MMPMYSYTEPFGEDEIEAGVVKIDPKLLIDLLRNVPLLRPSHCDPPTVIPECARAVAIGCDGIDFWIKFEAPKDSETFLCRTMPNWLPYEFPIDIDLFYAHLKG